MPFASLADLADTEHALLDGPAPCDDCWHAERCAAQRLACAAFSAYATGATELCWRVLPRQPSGDIYRRLLGTD